MDHTNSDACRNAAQAAANEAYRVMRSGIERDYRQAISRAERVRQDAFSRADQARDLSLDDLLEPHFEALDEIDPLGTF